MFNNWSIFNDDTREKLWNLSLQYYDRNTPEELLQSLHIDEAKYYQVNTQDNSQSHQNIHSEEDT